MSSAASKSDSQTPRQNLLSQAAERLADQSPSLGLPRLLAIDFLQGLFGDARARTKDSHRVQMEALGVKPEELAKSDDMGINVAGDTIVNITAPPAAKDELIRRALPLITAAALGAIGTLLPLGGYILANLKSEPPAAVAPADSAYDVLFFDKDGNPIHVPHISQRSAE